MLVVVSFTATVHALVRGEITLEQLANAEFYFTCQREHVLTAGLLPFECTWPNKELPSVRRVPSVSLEMVDLAHQQIILDFISLIKKKDDDDLVFWGLQHQPNFIMNLPDDQIVFWGKFGIAKDWK